MGDSGSLRFLSVVTQVTQKSTHNIYFLRSFHKHRMGLYNITIGTLDDPHNPLSIKNSTTRYNLILTFISNSSTYTIINIVKIVISDQLVLVSINQLLRTYYVCVDIMKVYIVYDIILFKNIIIKSYNNVIIENSEQKW